MGRSFKRQLGELGRPQGKYFSGTHVPVGLLYPTPGTIVRIPGKSTSSFPANPLLSKNSFKILHGDSCKIIIWSNRSEWYTYVQIRRFSLYPFFIVPVTALNVQYIQISKINSRNKNFISSVS